MQSDDGVSRDVDVAVSLSVPVSQSTRVRQLGAMFDCPVPQVQRVTYSGRLPLGERDWNIGLIVGPSGCGKTSILRHAWGDPTTHEWSAASVIDDFPESAGMDKIAEACGAVGFNTIPAWMRPFRVLSNGEQFRVTLARHLLSDADPIIVDEFTSVVDRQVAQIGSHAMQKHIRRERRRMIAASCHYDIIDWLNPDWILDPTTMQFDWRRPTGRPFLECTVSKESWSVWRVFAPYHYLTADLHKSAQCYVLRVDGRLASFAGVIPSFGVSGMRRVSRLVTLPDWQGLGLAMVLVDAIGSAYKATGIELRTYPAHPSLVRSFDRSTKWQMTKRPGTFQRRSQSSQRGERSDGGRPCATFRYVGEPWTDNAQARSMLMGHNRS